MRRCMAILFMAALAGCGVEVLTTTAIQGELQAQQLSSIRGQVTSASESVGQTNLQRAIDTFFAEKGYYPLTLDVLAPDYIPSIPVKADGSPYGYDATTGKIFDGPVPEAAPAPTPFDELSDIQRIARIRQAIDRYGPATGYYPPTLDALVPDYLPAVPKTTTGADFFYNSQDGTIAVPGQQSVPPPASTPAAPGAAPVGGAGPMGEVMTGIGIQQQLNSMGSSGVSAAGSYSREKIGTDTGEYSQKQEKTMDDLGL